MFSIQLNLFWTTSLFITQFAIAFFAFWELTLTPKNALQCITRAKCNFYCSDEYKDISFPFLLGPYYKTFCGSSNFYSYLFTGSHFHPSLIFASNALAYPLYGARFKGRLQALPTNIGLGWKGL